MASGKIEEKDIVRSSGLILYRMTVSKPIEFLLLQASSRRRHWTPPKGHIEKAEDALAAAVREMEEETGLEFKAYVIQDFKHSLFYNTGRNKKPKVAYYQLAKLLDSEAKICISSEHVDFAWVSLETAMRQHIAEFPNQVEMLRLAQEYIIANSS